MIPNYRNQKSISAPGQVALPQVNMPDAAAALISELTVRNMLSTRGASVQTGQTGE